MSLDHAREYLARVLPWSQEGDAPGWINVHWTFKSEKYDKPGWGGRAVTTVDDAVRAVAFAMKSPDTLDIYACQSSQREAQEMLTKKSGYKYFKPVRLQENAVALKAFFLDIDVKPAIAGKIVKGYPTMAEAVTALGAFIKATGLPKPSMMIQSGGGLHVYWVVDRALSPHDWYPLACALVEATKRHGLLLDDAVTTDAARVLRIPDTFNRKSDPPRAVRIAGTPTDFDYSVERIEKSLEPYKVATAVFHANTGKLQFEVPTPPQAPLQGISDLAAGIETTMPDQELRACLDAIPNNKVDWNFWNTVGMRVFAATDGADYGLAAWRDWSDTNSVSGTGESCDARWAVLQASPPTRTGSGALVNEVRTITGDPHWTPRAYLPAPQAVLNPQVTSQVTASLALGTNSDMPQGYTRTAQGIVMLLGTNEDGTPSMTPVSEYPIMDGWLQVEPWRLHFDTVTNRGAKSQISIACESVGGMDMRKILQSQGFMLRREPKLATEFFVAWITKLQASKDAVMSTSFGWSTKGQKDEGFVYGSRLWTAKGDTPAATADAVLARQYSPTGELQPWLDAADMITLQKRPALDAILASAFAAPLVYISGQTGLLMSAYSQESGIGKTTAVKVAQAVWGDPARTQGLDDTLNSVFGKMGQLRSLPIYWDEIKTEDDTKQFVKLTFRLTGGSEKSRMRANTTIHDSGAWQTLLISASNDSLLDYIVGQTSTSPAGLMRIFEYRVDPGTTHQISRTDADLIRARLNDNHGQAGLIYAKFLGENIEKLRLDYADTSKALGKEVNERVDERFWIAMVACVLLGAKYANELNLTDIDEVALKAFMIEKLKDMRAERADSPNDMRKKMNVSNVLAQFINAMGARHTVWTNRIHITAGKPPKGSIQVVRPTDKLDGPYVHIGRDDKLLRISSTYFSEWLKNKELSRHVVKEALEKEFGSRTIHGRIGSGTPHAGATEYLLQIDLAGTGNAIIDFIDEA
jgi:hypothetical protein